MGKKLRQWNHKFLIVQSSEFCLTWTMVLLILKLMGKIMYQSKKIDWNMENSMYLFTCMVKIPNKASSDLQSSHKNRFCNNQLFRHQTKSQFQTQFSKCLELKTKNWERHWDDLWLDFKGIERQSVETLIAPKLDG